MKSAIEHDQGLLTGSDTSVFRDYSDAIERLLAYHIYQIPMPVSVVSGLDKSESEAKSPEERIEKLYANFDRFIEKESQVNSNLNDIIERIHVKQTAMSLADTKLLMTFVIKE